jgi:hypothetical protein
MSNKTRDRENEKEAFGKARPSHKKIELEMGLDQTIENLNKPTVGKKSGPAVTAAVAASAGLALLATSLIGVGEVVVGGAAAYLAYRWLKPNNKATDRESQVKLH